jgi:3',5'-nucleoside bisphosphate phosphatase
MIDLHVHTTMSDGTLSPEEVVRLAAERNLRAIAITDHDTLEGIDAARAEGSRVGVEVVGGVEISAQWPHGILHILGYFVRQDDEVLRECLRQLIQGRLERVPKILSLLRAQNVDISHDEVTRQAVGGVPGRLHLAGIMLRKGHVKTLQEAFDRYLRKGAPAHVEKPKLPPVKAIELITEAGGVPVVAHPYSLNYDSAGGLERTLRDLRSVGLQGIEAYYPRHAREQTRLFLGLADKLDLVATGGSDFHGTNKPDVRLGIFPDPGPLPYTLLERLKARRSASSETDDAESAVSEGRSSVRFRA